MPERGATAEPVLSELLQLLLPDPCTPGTAAVVQIICFTKHF